VRDQVEPDLCGTQLYRDKLVAQGKESKVSAAVVFLPQDTLHYGKCGSDKCYCVEVSSEQHSPLLVYRAHVDAIQPQSTLHLPCPHASFLVSSFYA
jgi:hypothetical protein